MQKIKATASLRAKVKAWRKDNKTVAFVPTMGSLHKGHLSLVNKAKELADHVVVSIFVNPLQFDDKADLTAYPRNIDSDIQKLTSTDCDILFAPSVNDIYPHGMATHTNITVPNMDDKLCGLKRAGHFDGVATVVMKLFNIVQPDLAVFGEKDYQQLCLIKKMVMDLNLPIDIVGSPTFRERNGLAMSSRNQHLSDNEYDRASEIYQALQTAKLQLEEGKLSFLEIEQRALTHLQKLNFNPDYIDIRRAEDLERAQAGDKNLRVLIATKVGKTRLIDNIACNLA
ncbi:pantoate--beta-alanine ligase [Pseudomonadota bacterium]|nr:pantoate--beta-alanine ligase [Pseudomonadota bacterium]